MPDTVSLQINDLWQESGEYLMLSDLHVSNFRCFKTLDLPHLRRINVIVGRNASGKTALLEAIKLGLDGTPTALPYLNQWRNIPTIFQSNPTAEQFRALFADFFYGFDCDTPIEIQCRDSSGRVSMLKMFFDAQRATTIQSPPVGFQTRTGIPNTITPLAFERTDFMGQKSVLIATVNQAGQPFLQPGKQLGIAHGFVSSVYSGSQENATWLSQLSIAKQSEEVIESLRQHFPFIRQVTSESASPGLPPAIYADVSTLPRKVPLSLVSSGITRLFTLMLAIVAFKGGVILVDEVENGIFHDQYELVWKTLTDLAIHHNTQLFISTHSKECLKEALPIIQKFPDEFALLRARRDSDQSIMEAFSGEQMEAAIEKNGEVRD